MNDLVSSDRFSDLVAELVKQLHVGVRRDVRPQAAEEAVVGRGELHERDGLETEGRSEIGFEERFEDFVGENDHAERGEAEVRLVGFYLGRCAIILFRPFGSR
jgi:hypothetical protein